MHRISGRVGLALLGVLLCLAPESTQALPAGETLKVKSAAAGISPDDSLPAGIRNVLESRTSVISRAGEPLASVDLRKDLPLKTDAAAGLGVSFAAIPLSCLVGVIRFPAAWTDYRGVSVPAGTYTLRYGVQPADGNHMGVSVYRDFLILLKPGDDPGPEAKLDQRRLVDLGKTSSGAAHPWVLGLYPVEGEVQSPAMVQNEMGHWMLARRAGSLTLGMVILGQEAVEDN